MINYPYTAIKLTLTYTYPSDLVVPEKEYQVGGFAAQAVLERCTNQSLIKMAVEFEKLRVAFQGCLGQRGLGEKVDQELSRYFQVGRLDFGQPTETQQFKRSTRTVEIPDFNLLDLDED